MANLGVKEDRIKQISKDPHHVTFPPPILGDLFIWASDLTGEQLLAAIIIYTEKYTFGNGGEFAKMVMETLEYDTELRGWEPNIGDLAYSSVDKKSYFFTGQNWKEYKVG